MALLDTLYDVLSASVSAVIGVLVGFILNHKSRNKMASQVVISRQELEKIKLENSELLKRIQDKENVILQLQMQMLGTNQETKQKRTKRK